MILALISPSISEKKNPNVNFQDRKGPAFERKCMFHYRLRDCQLLAFGRKRLGFMQQ